MVMSEFPRAYALSGSNLVSFDPTNPTVGQTVGVTGLLLGDTLVGIDFRPQNGLLYGLGVDTGANTATLYAISTRTGAAAAIGTPFALADGGGNPIVFPASGYGMDFNATVDRIRVTTDSGLNFRINPNTGAPIDGDAAPGINPDGAISGAAVGVSANAYTNNQPNATVTTLYTLDPTTDQLLVQNPPNVGTQTVPRDVTLNGVPLDFATLNGFDIPAGVNVTTANSVASGSGLALLSVGGTTGLYSIDLMTGAATRIGDFLDGSTPASGLAIQNDLGGIPAIALSGDGTQLLRFNTATTGTLVSVPIIGVAAAEQLVGIDFRPHTGQLYAFGVDAAANTGTLYLVDPQGGTATAVGAPGQIAFLDGAGNPVDLSAGGWGMDFNPTVDRIRITNDFGLSFRINPNNGSPVDGDVGLAGINPDGAINGLPLGSTGVSANAYTNSYGQSLVGGVTTLYTLDPVSNALFIQNPPNAGTQTTQVSVRLDGSTLDFTSVNGFDIPAGVAVSTSSSVATGFGFAGLTVGGVVSLYMINLTSGEATNLGAIGTGMTEMAGFALADADGPPPVGPGDVLWQHNDGNVGAASGAFGSLPITADIAAGDFDGDGDSDVVWRIPGTQQAGIWEIEDGNRVQTHNLPTVPHTWQIDGTGDFDADGDSDILWRHEDGLVVSWEVQDHAYVTNRNQPAVPTTWQIDGTGDFDGDGDDDILWRHDDGQVVTWEMEGGVYVVNHNLPSVPTTWRIGGTGDFDGDGDGDIVWRHNDGDVVTWEMEDGAFVVNHNLGSMPTDFQIAGTADFDDDGDSDILWRHNDGTVVTWTMQDGALAQSNDLGFVNNVWQIRATGEFPLI
jgi:Domain of unknown function (DUF4394)/FG-GAP-like repeat